MRKLEKVMSQTFSIKNVLNASVDLILLSKRFDSSLIEN